MGIIVNLAVKISDTWFNTIHQLHARELHTLEYSSLMEIIGKVPTGSSYLELLLVQCTRQHWDAFKEHILLR